MPKAWSTPPVDFQKLIKQTEGQNLIGCLSGPEGYKGLLLEIGTFSETELEQIEKALPTYKEQEEQYKKHAQLWLRSENCQLQEQDEHIKIHVETTCLPIPTETPKMEIRASPTTVKAPTPENKPTRAERRIDPELQKLKCGQGGAYRWSMSKQSFNKVVCPFCIRSEDPSKSGINFIRADYWRRHITEVHKKENEIEHSKNLVLCLKCYHIGIDKAKEAKESGLGLPDFSSLFFTLDQRQEHEELEHKGEEIKFVSAWEKKEASQSRRKRTSHHSTDKNSHSAAKSSPSPQKSPQVPLKHVPPPTSTSSSSTTQLPSHASSPRVSSSSQLPNVSPMQMSPPPPKVQQQRQPTSMGIQQQQGIHRQHSAPAQIKLEPPSPGPGDPMSVVPHQIPIRLQQASSSNQMHHQHHHHHQQQPQQHHQTHHHQHQNQNNLQHSSKMDTIQIISNSFPPPQRSQSTSLPSPASMKQEIKTEEPSFLRSPLQSQSQCLPSQSPQSTQQAIRTTPIRTNQPGTSRQAVAMMEVSSHHDSSSLNSVKADPAFNFTINAEHSLNLDIDTSFGDFDIALPQHFEPNLSLNNPDQNRQNHHHQSQQQHQSFMARPLPKAGDGQPNQQRIPQILHSPQVQPAHPNSTMHMMNAHHMQVNPNNAHMMQVDPHPHQQQPMQVSLQRQLSHDPNNTKMSNHLQQHSLATAQNIQEILVKTEDDQEERDAEKQRKKERMPKLKCERGEVYVWNARQFYQKIICPMCDDRGGGCKELTVPHFRKHLEQVHTIEEIESVEVCRMCHRNSVAQRLDIFRGLVAAKDDNDRFAHFKKIHPGKAMHPTEPFISIFYKQRKSPNDDWGLDGVERDPNKVYKYATKRKKDESEASRNSQNNSSNQTVQQVSQQQQQQQQPQFNPPPQQQQQAHTVVLQSAPSFTNNH